MQGNAEKGHFDADNVSVETGILAGVLSASFTGVLDKAEMADAFETIYAAIRATTPKWLVFRTHDVRSMTIAAADDLVGWICVLGYADEVTEFAYTPLSDSGGRSRPGVVRAMKRVRDRCGMNWLEESDVETLLRTIASRQAGQSRPSQTMKGANSLTLTDVYTATGEYDDDYLILTPPRPAARIKGLFIELDHDGRHPQSWEFGEVDTLRSSNMLARDAAGNVVATDIESLFPEHASDTEHDRLVRYLSVADDESFIVSGHSESVVSAFRATIDGFVFERPTVRSVADAATFPVSRCRIWPAGGDWDGIVLFEDAVKDGLLSEAQADALEPKAARALRADALSHALAPFPDSAELLARLHA